jgi:hypothetical protein
MGRVLDHEKERRGSLDEALTSERPMKYFMFWAWPPDRCRARGWLSHGT